MTQSLSSTAFPALLAATVLFSPNFAPAADSVEATVQRELQRRSNYESRGVQAIDKGDLAMKVRDYDRATAYYKQACDFIPNGKLTQSAYNRALRGFTTASCRLAEQRITEGRYADAEATLKIVLDERYNPSSKEAVVILARLEDPQYYNRTIGPQFVGNVERVKQLFIEAQGFFDTDRFDLAFKRCEQILSIDPYNKAARAMQEKINHSKSDYYKAAYNEARSRAMQRVEKAWENPVRKFNLPVTDIKVVDTPSRDATSITRISKKLERTIIPRLDFKEATIREAVEFLKKKSLELDQDEPKTGVNIVLKLDAAPGGGGGGGVPEAPVPVPAVPGIPGLDPVPAAPAAPAAPAVPGGFGGNPADARITVSLNNIPLGEALKYDTGLANLKFKVEPFAVSIVPASQNIDVLVTREWKVRPDLIPRTPAAPGGAAGGLGGGGGGAVLGDASKGGTGIADRESAKNWLIANGVPFDNPKASAIYLVTSSRLIVNHTQDALDLIDTIINSGTGAGGPTQVEIEAKFVEISQNNLKELSFDWLLGAFNISTTDRVFGSGGTTGNQTIVGPGNYPFVAPGVGPVGTNNVTAGNRSGSAAISGSAVDALLFGTPLGAERIAPGIAALSGVFTDPQFQVVIRALNQRKGVDLLSAPRVTTKSGQRAVIEIIREFIYPTEFEPPQIPQNIGNNQGGGPILPVPGFIPQQPQQIPITPTTPTAFGTRNVGVTLEVEPVVGPDGYTIDLNLVPQVVEFEGFINYGSPIQNQVTNPFTGRTETTTVTPNTINQPVFSTRKVTTSVSVFDGNTVVLGGLMREDVQKIEDKVPLLGDIPIIGRLFRSSVDQHTKRNLVIFTSARIMKPDGDPFRFEEEKEEVIETLAPPDLGAIEPADAAPLPFMPK